MAVLTPKSGILMDVLYVCVFGVFYYRLDQIGSLKARSVGSPKFICLGITISDHLDQQIADLFQT